MRLTVSLAVYAALNACPVLSLQVPSDVDDAQKTLGGSLVEPLRTPSRPYTLKEHVKDAEVCVAGTKQYTGTVSVSDEKKLFFWFFESRNDPENSPVIIWLNGGPGSSSMLGLFEEIGPCLLNEHSNGTVFNKHSWAESANVLFIDQPAGVGFSTIRNGSQGGPDNLLEAAEDFTQLLITFFHDIFPQFAHNDFHIAGESFAGKYVPGFTHYISQQQKQTHKTNSDLISAIPPIKSIILVNALVTVIAFSTTGHYDHLCNPHTPIHPPNHRLNQTACHALELAIPQCERLATLCQDTYDPVLCETAEAHCSAEVGKWVYTDGAQPGGRDPYDDRKLCGDNSSMCQPLEGTGFGVYLNQSWVKEELGFGRGFNFEGSNDENNRRWEVSREENLPTTRELVGVLEGTGTRVLVVNGNNDVVINTASQKRIFDNLPWRRQAAFRMHQYRDWHWPDESGKLIKGGEIKAADDSEVANKLAFVSVDEAGHTSPGDQKEAVSWLVKCWTDGRREGTDSRCPF